MDGLAGLVGPADHRSLSIHPSSTSAATIQYGAYDFPVFGGSGGGSVGGVSNSGNSSGGGLGVDVGGGLDKSSITRAPPPIRNSYSGTSAAAYDLFNGYRDRGELSVSSSAGAMDPLQPIMPSPHQHHHGHRMAPMMPFHHNSGKQTSR